MATKTKNEKLKEKLFINKKSSWLKYNSKEQEQIFKFNEEYKEFLKNSKTERLCVKNVIKALKKAGFKEINKIKTAKTNDKVFKIIKNKAVMAFVVGKNENQLNIVGSHVDSPRLDLKPSPLYEESKLALLQSHYYGGVKKYHWVNRPLVLNGLITTKKGKEIEISIGQKYNEPKFIIPDLLPHLAKKQMEKTSSKAVEGEELNILVGNIPINDEKIKQKIKLNILKKLNDDFGLIEEDFLCAELEFVPLQDPVDIGIDKSMIGAYGQDDKVCVFTSLKALLETKNPKNTILGMFVDKEEIGSLGNTGAASFILFNFAQEYIDLLKLKIKTTRLLENSKAISADVTAGMNPNYKDVNDPKNVSYLGLGVSIEKYGGGGGKYSTNDAHSEYMHEIRKICDKNKVSWQTGELGKIDIGGGGTIAMFMSRYGMDCVDAGPCVLGMHSPCEVTSKADVYSSYLFYKAFFKE